MLCDSTFELIKNKYDSFERNSHVDVVAFYENLVLKKAKAYGKYNTSSQEKILYFVDGCIGSGKSTIMKEYIMENNILNLIYYSPEIYATLFYPEKEFLIAYEEAKDFLWKDMRTRLYTGESFIVESVFTKDSKINFLAEAKECGYILKGIYVATSSPNINIERVNDRVKQGSFHVPTEKIIDRYYKSIKYYSQVFSLANELLTFDNSGESCSLIAYKCNDNTFFIENHPDWFYKANLK